MIQSKSSIYSPNYLLCAVLFLIAMLACGCGSHPVTGTTIVGSIRVTADSSSISAGTTTQLHATSTSSAGQTSDVTSTVAWSSASPTVAVVGPTGVLTGMAAGNATITASLNGVSGALTASVGAPAVSGLTLTPKNAAVFTRGKQAYTAFATYANNTSGDASAAATWSVTPASVATISGGVVTAVAPGSYTVTAGIGTQTATAVGTVVDAPVSSIVVTPANPSIAGGTTQKFTATATYADGSTADVSKSFNWVSSDPTLLTIDANGLATAIKSTGTVTVSGQFGTTSAKVTVSLITAARLTGLVVTPTSSSIANGTAEPHTATASYSDGTEKDVTGSVTWSVVPGNSSSVGRVKDSPVKARALQAHAAFDSGAPVVAVDQNGVDWAMSPGITTVQASMGGLESQSVVIVTAATVQSLAITTGKTLFPAGSKQPVVLIGRFSDGTTQDLSLTANWVSSDPTVAPIDSKGNVTGVKAGKAQMSASFGGLSTSSGDITVLPSNLLYVTIKAYSNAAPVGIGEQLQMIGTYSDGTVQDLTSLATWSSANPNVETIESYGFIHPVGQGVTEVTGTVLGRTATISLAVVDTPALSTVVTAATPSFALGTTDAFTAITTFANGIQGDVTPVTLWTSSDPTVLTINSQGRAKAGKVGTATVTASLLGVTQTSFPVEVTAAQAWKVTVTPNAAQIAAQTGQQYKAIGFFNDNTVQDITGDAVWSTDDLTVARIDENGLLYGVKAGTTHVVCTFGALTTHYPVTVTAATLQAVAVSPANTELPIGVRRQFSLMGTFSDGTKQDLSATALWSSSTPFVVNVLGQGIIIGTDSSSTGSVSGQYGFLSASTSVNVTSASLASLALTPPDTSIRVGSLQPMTLTGTFSDGFTQVIDLDNVFVSSSPKVAQVLSSDDTAYAVGVGTTQITASYGGKSATTKSFRVLSNTITSLALSPENLTMKAGSGQQLLATATYADGSTAFVSRTVTWTSSNPAVLDVDGNGFAMANPTTVPVAVTVTATAGGATASFVVNVVPSTSAPATIVSAKVTPANASFGVGGSKQFVLEVTYSDGSTQNVTPSTIWTSSSPSVATISSTGKALGILPGSVTITGSFQGRSASTTNVRVTQEVSVASLVVKPTSSSIAMGSAEQHSAFAIYTDGTQQDVTQNVTWSVGSAASANGSALTALAGTSPVATVDQTGVDTAVSAGTTMVQASLGGLAAQSVVIVTPATVTSLAIRAVRNQFPTGAREQMQLIGKFSDGSSQDLSLTANWQSSNTAVATIGATGWATGVSAGNVTFTASFGGLTTSTTGVQVLPANLVAATIDVDYSIIALGPTEQFRMIGTYSDGSTHDLTTLTTWQSSSPNVFPIDQVSGIGYGLSAGTAQITGTVAGKSAIVNVAAGDAKLTRIEIFPGVQGMAHGTTQGFTAIGYFDNGAAADLTQAVVWRSNDPSVMTIDAKGRAKSGNAGTTQLTASLLGVTGTTSDLAVTPANLARLSIKAPSSRLAKSTGQSYKATGIFDDGTFQDLTADVVWDTSDNTTASIDTKGFGTGLKAGQVQVTASFAGQTASTPLTVTNATLLSSAVTPGNGEMPIGVFRQYTLTGTFSDGTQQDLTQDAIWSAPQSGIAAVFFKGQAIGISPGLGTISAQRGYFTASTPVTVTNASLTSMTMTPLSASIRRATVQNFTVMGTFSDGLTIDMALNAQFRSTAPSIASIFSYGVVAGVNLGSAQISASYRDQTVSTTSFQVTSDVLTSLAVSPASPSLFVGGAQQLTATGTYSDGTTGDVTANTVWTSSLPGILSIDQNGLATALSLTGLANGGLAPLVGSNQPVTVPATASSGGQTRAFNATVLPPNGPALRSVTVSPSSNQLAKGTTGQMTATATYSDGSTADVSSSATWTSSNTSTATVNSTGVVTAVAPGTASVTAQVGTQSGSATVQVTAATLTSVALTPNTASFAKGTSQQFTLTGTYSDGTTQNLSGSTSWTTSASSVASITSSGLATGVGTGSVTITGNYGGRTATSGTVQVTPATLASIAVTPTSASFAKGTTQQFRVTGTYTDGTTQDLTGSSTYASSNAGVVSVTPGGLATGTGTGSAQVTITSGGQTVTTGTVSVTPATLTSVTARPTSTHVAAGTTVQMGVTGTYTDGSTGDVTASATWTSSNNSLATVNAAGMVTGVSAGLPNVSAQIGSLTSSAVVRVSSATLVSVALSPSGASFAAGAQQKFVLTGTFSDGSTEDLSSSATWASSNNNVATVSSTGLASGAGTGTVAFTASYGGQTATTGTVTVTPATLVSLAVIPANPSFAKGTGQQFKVVGTYSDGTTQDLTGQSAFSSSDPNVVSVSNSGFGQALTPGSVQITVTAGGQTVTTGTVTATNATLVSVAVAPSNPSLAAGTTQQFTATGTFSDGTTQDLSGQSVWSSNNPQALTIDQNGLSSSFQVGSLQVSATINGVTGTSGVIQVTPASLASVIVTPSTVQVAKGTTQQMTATGTYTDGSTRNVSSMVTWTSSDGGVVSIGASGLATGTGVGSAQLTASLQGQTATTNSFMVSPATLVSIAFNPANPTVAAGSTAQVRVIGTYSDGTTQDLSSSATYNSSNTAAATVNATGGVAGVAPGTSTVTVQAGGQTGSFMVSVSNATLVSVAITPSNPAAFAKGTTQQFTATGTYSDGTTQNLSSTANWSSSNMAVFTVDQNGLATGTGVGSGQLTANYQGQTATTGSFSVGAATVRSIAVTPGTASLVAGATQQYTATATYTDNTTQDVSGSVTWSSSSTGVATVNTTGFATAVAAGSTTVTAQMQSLSGTANLTVTAAPVTLQQVVVSAVGSIHAAGSTQQFTATAVYSDQSTRDVTGMTTWSSTNPSVATINASGLATLVSAGNTTIQGVFGGLAGSMNVTIAASATLQSIAVNPSPASVAKGLTQQFTATGKYTDGSTQDLTNLVSWQSSNTQIATVNNAGLATSRIGGQAQIQASYQGQSAQSTLSVSPATLVSLALTPSAVNLANGTKQQFIATGTLSDGSTQDYTTSVTWSSSNTSFATVTSSGYVSASGTGNATITAQAGGVSRSATLTITAATPTSIQLTPSSVTVPVGGVQQMQATAMFTDGSSQDVTGSVTYTTSNSGLVTVDANGKLKGLASGNATITATLGSISQTASVQMTMVALNSLAITPASPSLAAGLSQQLTATGTYADGSTQDLTRSVTWTSSNAQAAAVNSTGNVTTAQTGVATITAAINGVSATDQVTVTAAAVTGITVSPASTTLAAGQTQQYAATASLTNGQQQDVTATANWSVSDPAKGTISNSGSTKGFLTSSAAGTLNVIATINSVTGSAGVTVQAAALSSLTIAPNPVSLPAGTTQALTVTGNYTDGSTSNLTSSAAFTTGTASIATVNTAGLLQGITQGSTSVQATVQGASVTAPVTVTQATLSSIAITPASVSLALGLQQQLTAIGTYTDGSTANITSQVQWSSSSASVGTVSASGLVSTLHTGNSTLMATLNGVTQQIPLTVTAATLQSIAVTSAQSSFALGLSMQLTATGTYTDGTTQNLTNSVTWSSTAPSVAMVSTAGLATGSQIGSFTARAAFGGKTGSLPLTVTAAVLQSIVVTPANSIIVNVTGSTQFTATGRYSDGTTQNLTNSAHWTVSGPVNVGTINQQGQLSGVHVGVAGTVTAAVGAISGSTGFTVVGLGI